MTDPALLFDRLVVCRGGVRVIDDFTATVPAGRFVSLVGPNGAGKTTLLKTLLRSCQPAAGRISIAGRSLESYSQRALARTVAYVPQEIPGSAPCLVRELVALGRHPFQGALAGLSPQDHAAIQNSLEQTRTTVLAERRFDSLSSGEKQRVLIAAALAQEPRLLLLDEPTAFQDPAAQEEILEILARLRGRLLTILLVTHNINHGALYADEIIGLKAGRLQFCGRPADFMQPDCLEALFGRRFRLVPHPVGGLSMVVPEVHDQA